MSARGHVSEGRVRLGSGTGIVVSGPATVSDQASYAGSTRPVGRHRVIFILTSWLARGTPRRPAG